MRIDDSQLKAFLLDQKLVAESDLAAALTDAERSGSRLHDVVLNRGLISEEKLRGLEAYILGIPFVDLSKEKIDPAVLAIVPEPIARKSNVIAYQKTGRDLEVAMLDPDDIQTIEFIKKKAKLRILPRLTTPASIDAALKQYQKSLEAEFGEIIQREAGELAIVGEEGEEPAGLEELRRRAEDLPIIRIVDTLIRHAVLQQASDIHLEPTEKEVVVRYRIDGLLHDAMTLPKAVAPGTVARVKVISNLKLDEHRLPQDGRFKIETPEYRISFRVSILPVMDGEKVVMRLLPESQKGFTLERLGFLPHQIELLHRHLRKPTGMVLVTGPTGSGKTTTLYTMLDILNKPGVNISTIEDPVEYRIPRINQTQVRPDIGFSFANGLRSLLRQDPDILMVGEIRDNETAALAVNAALTGHLVLSTLHTNSASGALPRLLDMKAEPFLIASTTNLITAQRLVRTLCAEVETYTLSSAEIQALGREIDLKRMLEILRKEKAVAPSATFEKIRWARPKKTQECPDGYKGRIGIHEVLEVTLTIQALIMKNATADEIEAQARREGMLTMLEDGFIKAAKGITTIEEVLRVTNE